MNDARTPTTRSIGVVLLCLAAASTVLAALIAATGGFTPNIAGMLLVAILIASWGVGRARGLGAFRLQDSKQRYLDVAEFVRGLPPNAVFLCSTPAASPGRTVVFRRRPARHYVAGLRNSCRANNRRRRLSQLATAARPSNSE